MANIGSKKTLDKIQGGDLPKFGKEDDTIAKKAEKLLGLHLDEKRRQELEEYMKKYQLKKVDEDGTSMILKGSNGVQFEIGGGSINLSSKAPVGSDEFIIAQIELAAVAKKAFGNDQVIGHAAGNDEKTQLLMEKIGGMAGLNLAEKSGKKLEDMDKALADKIEKIFAENAERLGLNKPQPQASSESALVQTAQAAKPAM